MKKLLLTPFLALSLTACGDSASDAEDLAVEFCKASKSQRFSSLDTENINPTLLDLYNHNGQDNEMIRTILKTFDCSVDKVEFDEEDQFYSVEFAGFNTLIVSVLEDRLYLKSQIWGTHKKAH